MLLHENPHVQAHSKLVEAKTEQESGARGGPSCVDEWRRPRSLPRAPSLGFWIQGPGSIDESTGEGRVDKEAWSAVWVSSSRQRKRRAPAGDISLGLSAAAGAWLSCPES